ncbi:hypothetical protein SBA2_820007 [Acidobacteriia bacterium SbA2]|nr:hypothetical protein SBA2_820007 [Acidobacteriia bacterium SbA2]
MKTELPVCMDSEHSILIERSWLRCVGKRDRLKPVSARDMRRLSLQPLVILKVTHQNP